MDTTYKSIHIFVALCDNKYQGIVPVPAKIGNGQEPNANLYWGCGYGIDSWLGAVVVVYSFYDRRGAADCAPWVITGVVDANVSV